MAYSCNPMENRHCSCKLTRGKIQPWLTAAIIPMENPYCSCWLTRGKECLKATAYSCNPCGESLLQL